MSGNQFMASAFALLLRPAALKALILPFSSSSVAAVVSAAAWQSYAQSHRTSCQLLGFPTLQTQQHQSFLLLLGLLMCPHFSPLFQRYYRGNPLLIMRQ